MQTGPVAGDHPWMGTQESGCSGGKRGIFVLFFSFAGNEQTVGLGPVCVSPAPGAGGMCAGEQPEVRLGLKQRHKPATQATDHL